MNYKVHVCNDKKVYSTDEGNRENVFLVPEEWTFFITYTWLYYRKSGQGRKKKDKKGEVEN